MRYEWLKAKFNEIHVTIILTADVTLPNHEANGI